MKLAYFNIKIGADIVTPENLPGMLTNKLTISPIAIVIVQEVTRP